MGGFEVVCVCVILNVMKNFKKKNITHQRVIIEQSRKSFIKPQENIILKSALVANCSEIAHIS
jgi:hypothetical protein